MRKTTRTLRSLRRGMYGLKEAGIIAFDQLAKRLAPHGYHPVKHTPGLWKHSTRPTTFTLCVDDFGIKYMNRNDALHLIAAVTSHYEATVDWTGSLYCGLTLSWDYEAGHVDVSMPGYVSRALQKFNHPPPKRPQHAPQPWVEPVYGSRLPQQPTPISSAPPLDPKRTQRIQAIWG